MTSENKMSTQAGFAALLSGALLALADAGVIGVGMTLTWPVAAIVITSIVCASGIAISYNMSRTRVKVADTEQKRFVLDHERQQKAQNNGNR